VVVMLDQLEEEAVSVMVEEEELPRIARFRLVSLQDHLLVPPSCYREDRLYAVSLGVAQEQNLLLLAQQHPSLPRQAARPDPDLAHHQQDHHPVLVRDEISVRPSTTLSSAALCEMQLPPPR
jgi:hypothetical protein